MLDETLARLRDGDFIRGEESVNRDALSDAIIEVLVRTPVIEEAQIETQGLILAELRHQLFGDLNSEEVEDELDDIIRPLVSSEGKVQTKLPDELVLCARQVTRRLGYDGGASTTVHKRAVFVTDQADLIVDFYLRPQAGTAQRANRKYNRMIDLSIKRQPLVAAKRRELVQTQHEQYRLELPMGDM